MLGPETALAYNVMGLRSPACIVAIEHVIAQQPQPLEAWNRPIYRSGQGNANIPRAARQ